MLKKLNNFYLLSGLSLGIFTLVIIFGVGSDPESFSYNIFEVIYHLYFGGITLITTYLFYWSFKNKEEGKYFSGYIGFAAFSWFISFLIFHLFHFNDLSVPSYLVVNAVTDMIIGPLFIFGLLHLESKSYYKYHLKNIFLVSITAFFISFVLIHDLEHLSHSSPITILIKSSGLAFSLVMIYLSIVVYFLKLEKPNKFFNVSLWFFLGSNFFANLVNFSFNFKADHFSENLYLILMAIGFMSILFMAYFGKQENFIFYNTKEGDRDFNLQQKIKNYTHLVCTIILITAIVFEVEEEQLKNSRISIWFFIGTVFGIYITPLFKWFYNVRKEGSSFSRSFTEVDRHLMDVIRIGFDQHSIISCANTEGYITYANANFSEISQYGMFELLGKKHSIVKSDLHTPEFYSHMWKTISAKKTWKGVVANKAKDGSIYWVNTTIVPILNDDGSIREYVSLRTDITKLKNAKENLKKLLGQLNKAEEVKMNFLSNISHEIKTPLNLIMGITADLEEKITDSEMKKELNLQSVAGISLVKLLDNILAITKKGSSLQQEKAKDFELSALIEDTMNLVNICANKNRNILTYTLNTIHNMANSYPVVIGQILFNILSNSCKFTKNGQVSLAVDQEFTEQPGGCVSIFTITDSGIGMANEKLESMVNAFEQNDSSFTRDFGGLGLGLTVSSNLLKGLNGKMTFDNLSSGGLKVIISIPHSLQEKSRLVSIETKLPLLNLPKEKNEDIEKQGARILIVDDSEENVMVCKMYLKKYSTNITTAVNGLEGVEKYKDGDFDLILMDIQMPVMDGFEATNKIREWEEGKGLNPITIIGVSAYSADDKDAIHTKVGFNEFIPKPIRKDIFVSKITKFIEEVKKAS